VGVFMCEFWRVWVCVRVNVFENCVGVLVICILVFNVFLYYCIYIYLFVFVTSVRTTATE